MESQHEAAGESIVNSDKIINVDDDEKSDNAVIISDSASAKSVKMSDEDAGAKKKKKKSHKKRNKKEIDETDDIKIDDDDDDNDENKIEEEIIEICTNRIVKRSQVQWEEIANMIVKCTACGKQVNHNEAHRLRKHPMLGILVCKECFEFYGNGEFSEDDEGEKYCRWCAQGGVVYGCDYCQNVFCANCLRRNFGRGEQRRIQDVRWKCYVCDPTKIKGKVGFCNLIIEYATKCNRKNFTRNMVYSRAVRLTAIEAANLDPESVKPEKWLPLAFEVGVNLCNSLDKRLKRLMKKYFTKAKSTKQIVLKFEQILEKSREDLKATMAEINHQYSYYLHFKKSNLCNKVEVASPLDDSDDSSPKCKSKSCSETAKKASIKHMMNGISDCDNSGKEHKTKESSLKDGCDADHPVTVDSLDSSTADELQPTVTNGNDIQNRLANGLSHNSHASDLEESCSEVLNNCLDSVSVKETGDTVALTPEKAHSSDDSSGNESSAIQINSSSNSDYKRSKCKRRKGSIICGPASVKAKNAKLSGTSLLDQNISHSSSDESDSSLSSGKENRRKKMRKRRKKPNKAFFTKEEIAQWKRLDLLDDEKLRCTVKVKLDKLNIPVSRKDKLISKESSGEQSPSDSSSDRIDDQIKKLANVSKLSRRKREAEDSPTAIKQSSLKKSEKKGKNATENKDTSASDSFSLTSDEEEKKDIECMSKFFQTLNGNSQRKSFSDIVQESFASKEHNDEKDESSSDVLSGTDTEPTPKKNKQLNDKKKKRQLSVSSDSSDFQYPKKKKKQDKLLSTSLAMSDEENKKTKKAKGEPKEKSSKSKGRKKKRLILSDSDKKSSDSSDSDSSDTSSGDSKPKKGKKATGKRKRIKVTRSSADENEASDADGQNNSQSTPGKGRKNIRKLISDKKLTEETREAQETEKERKRRVFERQKLYNQITDTHETTGEVITKKMVLEVDPESKDEIVEIDPDLVEKLKPHQVNGIKFMWECTIESLKELEAKPGSGCILAHCMGLGKTLQVITFLHTVLTNKLVNKKIRTAMVICPYNTVLNWSKEFEIWLEDIENPINLFEITSLKDNYSRHDCLKNWHEDGGVLIIGYTIFARLVEGKMSRASKKLKQAVYEFLADPGPDIVVCDEGHMLKNENSSLSKAANKLKTQRRIVLTGTPLQNNLKEYHCMMSFVKPRLLGTSKEFLNRFVNPINNGQYDDSSKHDVKLMKKRVHILHKLLEGCVQRCDYSALTKFLPPKHEFVISVKLSEVQLKLYKKYLDEFRSDKDRLDGGKLFKDYNALKNIWTYPYLLVLDFVRAEQKRFLNDEGDSDTSFINDDSEAEDKGSDIECINENDPQPGPSKKRNDSSEDEVVKIYKTRSRATIDIDIPEEEERVVGEGEWWREYFTEDDKYNLEMSGKMVLVRDILKECESIGDKVLLFSQSLLTLDMIQLFLAHWDETATHVSEEEQARDIIGRWVPGVDYFRMDGATGVDLRKHWIEIFNNPENYRARLFLISTKAGSLGTNLVGANRVIIMDSSWNPSHDVQAIFRVYRFGQNKPVYIYRLLAQGSMEEKIYNRQVTKLSLSCRVVDEQQIDRHFNAAQLSELYTFEPDVQTNRPTPMVPKDRLLADLLIRHIDWIVTYHEHDSLLQSSTEDDLTEEERQAAWTEYENEKEGIYNNTFNANMGRQQQQNQNIYSSISDMYNGQTVPDITVAIRTIMEQIKRENPLLPQSGLMSRLAEHLLNLKAYYQNAHCKALRFKTEAMSKGIEVPQNVTDLLTKLAIAQQQVSQYINEAKRMAAAAAARTGVPPPPQAAFTTQQPRYHMYNRGNMRGNMRMGYNPRQPVYVNINTGHRQQFPAGFKIVNNFPPQSSSRGPTIVEVESSLNDKDANSPTITPIITLVDESDEPEVCPSNSSSSKPTSSSSVLITELE